MKKKWKIKATEDRGKIEEERSRMRARRKIKEWIQEWEQQERSRNEWSRNEFEDLKLQLEVKMNIWRISLTEEVVSDFPKFELGRITPKFNPKE